ncbi:MAG: two-component system sensor histidine kinase NtrB [Myxococcota bacterium]
MEAPQETKEGYVSGRMLDDVLRALARRRIDVPGLLVGLPVDRDALRRGHPLVDWDVFVEIMARLEFEVGGPRGLQDLGERVAELKPAVILRRLAGLSASPVLLYRAAERWALRRAIPLLANRIEKVDRNRLRVVCSIPEPHRPCPQLLHLATGVLRAAPRILDLPEAAVSADVQPARAEYAVFLPDSGTLGARAIRAFRALFSARAAFDQLETQQGEIQRHFLELRAAYAVLEESEARHRALTETAVDIVFELDTEATVTYVSPSTEELTGYRPDQLMGTDLGRWLHPDDVEAAEREFEHTLLSGSGSRPIFRVRHRRGGWLSMEIEGRTYRAADGELRLVAICRDVSERIRLEAERQQYQQELEEEVERRTAQLERRNRELRELQSLLLHAERMGAAQDLAGRIAHSIHNPLGALIGHLQLALRAGGGERSDEVLERALGLAVRVSDVVKRVLNLFREGKADLRSEDSSAILDELTRELEGRALLGDVEVEVCNPEKPTPVLADRTLLVSALTALAQNSLESMEQGGHLRLSAAPDASRDRVVFEVEDDGPGVPADVRAHVFDPFFTTKRTGSGLGLAIAKGVVTGHGGEIELLPGQRDRGTLVRVSIPNQGPPAERPPSDSDRR